MTRIAVLLAACLLACSSPDPKERIEEAMQTYNRMIISMNADSIANLYAQDGQLGPTIIGRDSIRKFLETFRNVRVLSNTSQTNLINISGDTALQEGLYTQSVIVNGDTLNLKGTYRASWKQESGKWLIKKMITHADK